MLAQEKRDLEKAIAEKEKQLRIERNQRVIDNARNQEMLKDTVYDYELKIKSLSEDADELYRIFVKELSLKDNILDQTNQLKDLLVEKTKRLTLKLKTPRHHLKFQPRWAPRKPAGFPHHCPLAAAAAWSSAQAPRARCTSSRCFIWSAAAGFLRLSSSCALTSPS